MTGKKLNILIVISIVLFCLIGGFVGVYNYNKVLELDRAHDLSTSKEREDYEKNTLEDIKTSTNNENKNDGNVLIPSKGSSSSQDNVDISQFNFVQMYEHAESKLGKAQNIYSQASGDALLSGPTSFPGIKLNNEKVNFNFTRAKNSFSNYTNFVVSGNLLNGLFNLNYETASYYGGQTYYWYFNQDGGWKTSSKAKCYEKLRFEPNQTFNDVNANSIKAETATLFYNKYDKTYTGSCELNPSVSGARYAYTLQGVMDGLDKAEIISSKIEVTFDNYGNFKTIRYIDEFKINVYNETFKTTMYATLKSDYTEHFITIGNRNVIIDTPKGI